MCVLDPDRGANLATKTVNDLLPSMAPNKKTTLLLTILVEEGGTSGLNHQWRIQDVEYRRAESREATYEDKPKSPGFTCDDRVFARIDFF